MAEFEWTPEGKQLLGNIKQMFKNNGGYKIYRLEAMLENESNKKSQEALRIKKELRREKNTSQGR